jgi:hypothetical protein
MLLNLNTTPSGASFRISEPQRRVHELFVQLAAKKVHPLGALTAKGGEPSTIMTQVEGSGLSA